MDKLRHVAQRIGSIKPGQRINIDRHTLEDCAPTSSFASTTGLLWSPAERVMENIIGSAYEFRFWMDPMTGDVIFERLNEPLTDGRRTFVSPDRRHRAELREDGFWHSSEPHFRG